jgi:hypothetical protein
MSIEIEFTSAAIAHHELIQGIGLCLAFLVATLLMAALSLPFGAKVSGRTLRRIALASLVLSGLACTLVYEHARTRFTSLTDRNGVLSLHYPIPFGHTVDLPNAEVKEVLFGLPGKRGHVCHLRITSHSDDVYISADTMLEPADCKDLRARVVASIHGP